MNRDISVLQHIVKYCDDIETTVSRFGEIFETATTDIIGLKAKCLKFLDELKKD